MDQKDLSKVDIISKLILPVLNKILPIPALVQQQQIVAKLGELMALCDQLKSLLSESQQTQLHLADAIVEQSVD